MDEQNFRNYSLEPRTCNVTTSCGGRAQQGGMDGARNLLAGTLERFTKVFETSKGAKTMLYLVGGMVLAALAVYFLLL